MPPMRGKEARFHPGLFNAYPIPYPSISFMAGNIRLHIFD